MMKNMLHHDQEHLLPEIDQDSHFHGVTIGSRSGRSTAMSYATTKKTKDTNADVVPLPKTYTTRKGALQLYVAPFNDDDDADSDEELGHETYPLQPKYAQMKRPAGQELIDLSLKLGTMGRLAISVLNFGDQDYDKEHASITDAKNKAFLKFLRGIDDQSIQDPLADESLRPGGDLNSYLRELRSSSSMRNYGSGSTYVPKNREFLELQALLRGLDNNSWPLSYQQDGLSDRQSSGQFTRPVSRVSSRGGTPGPPSTPRSTYKVLSSKQLTASLKSSSYLGRPSSQFSVNDDDDIQSDIDSGLRSVTSAGLHKKPWTPETSTDELLIDKFFKGSSDDWETAEEGNKRRRFKERSFLTGTELLSQGRNSQKGEGFHNDLRVKGEGYSPSKGQTMNQITEEAQEDGNKTHRDELSEDEELTEDESDVTGQWAEHVTKVQQTITKIKPELIEIDEKADEMLQRLAETTNQQVIDTEKESKPSRPGSNVSLSSRSSHSSFRNGPSVVSLQSFSAQKPKTPPEGNGLLYKRRKSLSAAIAFDPERLKNAIQGPRSRPKSSHAEKTHPFLKKGESIEQNENTAPRKYSSSLLIAPQMAYWSTNGVETPQTGTSETIATDTSKEDNTIIASHPSPQNEVTSLPSSPDKMDESELYKEYDNGIIEEEALLRDIKECNEEVEQIEAMGEAEADTDSDSGTYVDEEVMKELIEAEQTDLPDNQELTGQSGTVTHEGEEDKVISEACDEDSNKEDEHDEQLSEAEFSLGAEKLVENEEENLEEMVEARTAKGEAMEDETEIQVDEVRDELSESPSRSSRKFASKTSSKDGESAEEFDSSSEFHRVGLTGDGYNLGVYTLDTVDPGVALDVPDNQTEPFSTQLDETNQHKNISDEFIQQLGTNDTSDDLKHTDDNTEVVETDGLTANDASKKDLDPDTEQIIDDEVTTEDKEQDQAQDVTLDDTGNQKEDDNAENGVEIKVVITDKNSDAEHLTTNEIETDDPDDVNTVEIEAIDTSENTSKLDVEAEGDEKDSSQVETPEAKTTSQVKKQSVLLTKSSPKTHSKQVESKTARNNLRKPFGAKLDRSKPQLKHAKTVAALDTSRVGGSDLEANAGAVSSLAVVGEGGIDTDGDALNEGTEQGTSSSITDELDALGLRSAGKKKGKKTEYALLPPGKRPKAPPEKTKIPDHIKEAMDRKTMESYENLEKDLERRGFLKDGKVTALVDQSLSGPTLEAVGEGLTEEEFEMAKLLLQKKIEEAKLQLDGKEGRSKGPKKKVQSKGQKKGKKKKDEEEKSEEELQREAIREKQAAEQARRDEEKQELQRQIAERRKLLQEQNDAASAKAKELREQMEKLEQEAEDLQRAEDEARDILQEVRKKQREERDARRKADLERRKQDALDRREREKKELEDKKRKELEMMEKIADAEMRRRLREEEERRLYEEERLAQERYEEELREAQRLEEEEEERMRELERQAEEEAMQRLIEEREAAERQKRRLVEEEEKMQEAERLKREMMLLEEQKLAEERRKIEEEEQRKRQREIDRLMELRRAEEEARQKLQEEVEKRRSEALARRDFNLENKQNVDKLRHYQGITRAWTFSYFVKWPRETYENQSRRSLRDRRPIGEDSRKKVKINNPPPKKADPPAEGAPAEAPAQ